MCEIFIINGIAKKKQTFLPKILVEEFATSHLLGTRLLINTSDSFLVTEQPRGSYCSCYYNQTSKNNVYKCLNKKLYHLPKVIPAGTNCIVIHNASLHTLCKKYFFPEDVTHLNLSTNRIKNICPSFLQTDTKTALDQITELDISNNLLKSLPREIVRATKTTKIWLSKNPYMCNCDMLWMVDWLANAKLSSGKPVVQDYKDVTCSGGIADGIHMYRLNQVDIGCYPSKMATWEIGLLAATGAILILIGMTMFFVFKKWKEVKFWLYQHFDILDKRDRGEDLSGIRFDALISYR